MRCLRTLLASGIAAVLLACGGAPQPDPAADTAAASTPIPDSVPLVVMHQEGGVAGATSELTVHRTGEVTLAQDPAPGGIPVRRWTAAASDYQAVAELIASPEFTSLAGEYLPEDTCCDRITYTITVPGAAGDQTVRTMDAARQPESLARLIERLRALETAAPQ